MDLATRKLNMIAYLLAGVNEDVFERYKLEYGDEQVLGFDNY